MSMNVVITRCITSTVTTLRVMPLMEKSTSFGATAVSSFSIRPEGSQMPSLIKVHERAVWSSSRISSRNASRLPSLSRRTSPVRPGIVNCKRPRAQVVDIEKAVRQFRSLHPQCEWFHGSSITILFISIFKYHAMHFPKSDQIGIEDQCGEKSRNLKEGRQTQKLLCWKTNLLHVIEKELSVIPVACRPVAV